VDQHPFPGPERGGQPPPGGPARDGMPGGAGEELPAGVPGGPADDWDPEAEMAAFLADVEAGRARIPGPWEVEGPAAGISLGDAADVDLAELGRWPGRTGWAGTGSPKTGPRT